jgi:hypothetical protein
MVQLGKTLSEVVKAFCSEEVGLRTVEDLTALAREAGFA